MVVLISLLGGVTLLGFLDRWSPYLELLTIFRLHYAGLLGVAALVAILVRRFRLALVALVLAGVNLLVISHVALAPATASTGPDRLRALIVNVQDGNAAYDRLERLIAKTDPDLVGVIELTPAWAQALESVLKGYRHRSLQPEEGAYGIGLYSRLSLTASRIEDLPTGGSPSVVATVALAARPFAVVITHLHTPFAGGSRSRQLRALADELRTLEHRSVLCGDFNTVPWSQPISELAGEAGLRSIHGRFGLAGTWPANARLLRIPIDNCFVSEGIAVTDHRTGPDIGSDHLPLIVDFALFDGLVVN